MKAALANIGELQISEQAFALEKAGLNSDREFIAAQSGRFIETLESLIGKIYPTEILTDTDEVIVEDTVYLAEQLEAIKQACEDYDRKAAFLALDLLKEKQWKPETVAMLEIISDMLLLHSDFDGAAELLQKV
jgi:hypothetical protein